MSRTGRKTRCLENKSFRWTKLQKRAAKKTSNCSKKDTNYLKSWKIAWHFFHPGAQEPPYLWWFWNHHISWLILHPSCWQRPRSARSACFGVPPFLSAKPLSPNRLVDSTKVFNWRGVFDSGYGQFPSKVMDGRHFFHTLLWCLWRDSKKRTQWWCETRLHFWLSLYSKLVINSNWK